MATTCASRKSKDIKKIFCSRKCAGKYRSQRLSTTYSKCQYCNKKLKIIKSYQRKYCSIKCRDLYKKNKNIKIMCPTCKKFNRRSKSRINRIFCNRTCQKEYRNENK
jgi:endogenous inhibitor of DNA gyrase (YacG/DUF329 family)